MLVEYVLGGCTPKLQVVDVGIDHPFKIHFQQSFTKAKQDIILVHGLEKKFKLHHVALLSGYRKLG